VLDRLDVLPVSAQVSLLRVLEERLFTPLGGSTRRALRARVVSTVGAGVRDAVESRILRSDLFHRIAGYHAVLPPLRERRSDILPFARAFVRRQSRRLGRPLRLGPDAEDVLLTYPWPGNFRELGAALTRACLGSAQETLAADALGLAGSWDRFAEAAAAPGRTLRDMVRSFALLVLAQEGGNVSRAARSLGISRRTLIRWRQGR
jgi:DNA-binding NtrC family response regulator